MRWHKTGKTKPIMKNGIQRGFKKIMVLYGTSKSGSKPERCNWVMHQFHLGTDEEEKEGEYVVSKIFHQTQKENENHSLVMEESDIKAAVQVIPTTPKITTPDLPRHDKTPYSDCNSTDHFLESLLQEVATSTLHHQIFKVSLLTCSEVCRVVVMIMIKKSSIIYSNEFYRSRVHHLAMQLNSTLENHFSSCHNIIDDYMNRS